MNRMSWPKRWPTWKDLWRTLMPSLQHDHLHQDMTPNSFTSLGTQPWNTRNCTEKKKKNQQKKRKKKQNRKRDSTREHTQKANEPTGAFVLQLVKKRWPFLSSSCNEVIAKLNSIYLLRPCRMGHISLKSSIQTKGKKKMDFMGVFFLVRFCLSGVIALPFQCWTFAFMYNFIWVFILSFFIKRKKYCNQKKKRRNRCFPRPRPMFDCLFYCVWKFIASVGCSVFLFCV